MPSNGLRRTRVLAAVGAFNDEARPALDQLGALCVGTRGPRADATGRTVLLGIAYAALSRRPSHVSEIREAVGELPHHGWGLFDAHAGVPSPSGLYRTVSTFARVLERAMTGTDPAVLALVDAIVEASGGPRTPHDTTLALDTSYVDAYAVPRPHGVTGSDPDATGRVLLKPNGDTDKHYGYALLSIRRAGGSGTPNAGDEVTRRFRLLTANADDVAASTDLVHAYRDQHPDFDRLLIDRGFSQRGGDYLEPLRHDGLWVHFDLKSHKAETRVADYHGYPVLDGWPHSPRHPPGAPPAHPRPTQRLPRRPARQPGRLRPASPLRPPPQRQTHHHPRPAPEPRAPRPQRLPRPPRAPPPRRPRHAHLPQRAPTRHRLPTREPHLVQQQLPPPLAMAPLRHHRMGTRLQPARRRRTQLRPSCAHLKSGASPRLRRDEFASAASESSPS